MDFYKSRNSNSTSSQHSNSNSSFKSHASSNNGTSYNLEYCTSSSSVSPFGARTAAANLSSIPSCPASSAKTIVNVGLEEVLLSISNNNSRSSTSSTTSSHISASPSSSLSSCSSALALSKFSNNMCSSSRNSNTATASSSSSARVTTTTAIVSSTAGTKRKRCASTNLDESRDPELDFEPSAKRQQCISALYKNDNSSVVSSVYPSPVDDILAQELDTHSSSECLSNGTDFKVVNNVIPDSPDSPDPESPHRPDSPVPDSPDSRDSPDSPDSSDNIKHDDELLLHREVQLHDDDEVDDVDELEDDDYIDHITDDDDVDDMVSDTTSEIYNPVVARFIAYVQNGERTPGQRLCTSQTQSVNNKSASQITQPQVKSFDEYLNSHYHDCMTPAADAEPLRQCPLPALSWANAQDVWQLMCKKDEQASCLRDCNMLDHHPGLQPRMRAILLDWLIEVCEVYKLHRETYYLAVDYLDRYLSAQKNVQKTHLQLIGITCLFVAAKVEEVYPPKIGEFAYVTDGACQESDILQHEILLLQALEWSISPITPIGWLGVYMQLNVNNRTPASFQTSQKLRNNQNPINTASKQQQQPALNNNNSMRSKASEVDDAFIYPQFSGLEFVQTGQLIDLCSLDVGFGNFPYSVLAAAAISHTFNRETALRCSGLDWQTIESCARWMQPFFEVISEESHNLHLTEQNEQINTKFGLGHICPNIVTDDSHIIQTHTTTMTMFDRVCLLQEQLVAMVTKIKQEASPATGLMCPDGLLTPPASSRKPMVVLDEDNDDGVDDNDDDNHLKNLQNTN